MNPTPDKLEGERLLDALWREPATADLRCLLCQEPFTADALIRTFRIDPPGDHEPGYSTVVSTENVDILFFDRHITCAVDHKIKFSAVSHVWDPSISNVQQQRQTVPQTTEAAHRVLDISANIYNGIGKSGHVAGELWLDYLSVPQWSDALRDSILLIMHKLYSVAETTIVHMGDISPAVSRHLYAKERSQERLSSAVTICNSRYFQRVWTAMELIRSGRVRMMVGDYTYLADIDDPAFINRVYWVWNNEVRHHKQVQDLEAKVGMGKNQVPWSLGLELLNEAKSLGRVNFAMGTALLCKRRCRDRMDFLHALRGIVPVKSSTLLGSDFKTEYNEIAWECLKEGDLSPLLITPSMGLIETRGPKHWSDFAYCGVCTWQLGKEAHPPVLAGETHFNDTGHLVSLQLIEIGVVSVIKRPVYKETPSLLNSFSFAAKVALELDGPNVQDFVAAIERTHGGAPSFIMTKLKETKGVQRLQNTLIKFFNDPCLPRWPMGGSDGTEWLAKTLHLLEVRPGSDQSVIGANLACYATMHCAPYDYTVGITCMSCHRTFVHRIASFVLPTELCRAKAYRIPNLKYRNSHQNGVALLVQKDRVVGRMIWATPACACTRIETVTLGLPEFFLFK